ncbi:MAG: hypothetical protein SFW67_03550 [Myxococcaceae bacterium]|nr:hypothetical protein [Myxococcaceae bacterium]
MRWLIPVVAMVLGCGGSLAVPQPQVACGPSNCRGCCSSSGACVEGTSNQQCGLGGEACLSCGTGRLCVAGVCGVEPLPVGAKLVFVTRSTFVGSFGSVEQADSLCMAAAAAGNLPGTFKAWVSANGYDAARQMRRVINASERLTSNGPWYLPGVDTAGRRIQIFANRSALRAAPLKPIDRTETLEDVSATGRNVWTGTLSTGLGRQTSSSFSSGTCNDWGSGANSFSDDGIVGTVYGKAGDWTEFDTRPCSNRFSLYCFED